MIKAELGAKHQLTVSKLSKRGWKKMFSVTLIDVPEVMAEMWKAVPEVIRDQYISLK